MTKKILDIKTIQQQTGWKRPCDTMICQDTKVLLKIREYSFDLSNEGFVRYFKGRTGISLGKEDKPELSLFLLTSPEAEEWLLTSHDYKFLNGETVPFGIDEYGLNPREIDVRINKISKGMLQDCWELFTRETES